MFGSVIFVHLSFIAVAELQARCWRKISAKKFRKRCAARAEEGAGARGLRQALPGSNNDWNDPHNYV